MQDYGRVTQWWRCNLRPPLRGNCPQDFSLGAVAPFHQQWGYPHLSTKADSNQLLGPLIHLMKKTISTEQLADALCADSIRGVTQNQCLLPIRQWKAGVLEISLSPQRNHQSVTLDLMFSLPMLSMMRDTDLKVFLNINNYVSNVYFKLKK